MLFLSLCFALLASDWTRFRGPNGTGISPDRGLPSEIGKDRNVLWSQKTLKGHSSPIVIGNRLFITGYEGDERVVLCYESAKGEQLWRRSVSKARTEVANPNNGPATPTPASDGSSIFVFFPEFGLLAYDFEGKERWRVPLGPSGGIQGMAESPIVADGNVILLIDTPEAAYLAAYGAGTGKQVWKVERPIGFLGSYATPALYQPAKGPTQIIVSGAVELTGYQAKTGERLWWARGVTITPATSPLVADDAVYTMEPVLEVSAAPPFRQMLDQYDKNKTGTLVLSEMKHESLTDQIMYGIFKSVDKVTGNNDGVVTEQEWMAAFTPKTPGGGLVRTRLDGKGDVSQTHIDWRYTKGIPYLTTPILYEKVLYVIRDGGIVSTFDPKTGKVLREARLKDAIGEYWAQPVAGDGKVYFVSKEGKVSVIRAGAEWEKLSTGDLDEQVIATPAIAGGRVYIRTEGILYCFGS